MTVDVTAVDADASVPATWDDFAARLEAQLPGVPIHPHMTLGSLLAGDRIVKGLASAAIRRLLLDPPDELLAADATLAELCEWRAVRLETGRSPQVALSPHSFMKEMSTSNVRLRPIHDSDIPNMFASATDPRWSHRWRYRGTTPSIAEFVSQLHQGVLAQFVVERLSSRNGVGLVTCYNARVDAGWAYIAFTRISAPDHNSNSDMLEGGFLFLSFLFRNWNFRKLYAEVPGWNWEQFERGSGEFFTVEGVLKEHEFFDGRHWDQYLVALHRRQWEATSPLLTDLYCSGGTAQPE